jgi:hypothetical protein
MVLAHYGDVRTEAEPRLLLGTQPTGTRAGNVMRISGPDYEVFLRSSNMLELQKVLAARGKRGLTLSRAADSSGKMRPAKGSDPFFNGLLASNQPPIVFLQTGSLEYWSMNIFHTVVLVGLDTVTAALHDPYFTAAPQTTSLQSFEKAWAQTGQFAAFIRPRPKATGQKLSQPREGAPT